MQYIFLSRYSKEKRAIADKAENLYCYYRKIRHLRDFVSAFFFARDFRFILIATRCAKLFPPAPNSLNS